MDVPLRRLCLQAAHSPHRAGQRGFRTVRLYGDVSDYVVVSDDIPTRVRIEPSPANGLLKTSWIATEKIMAVPVNALKNKVGQLSKSDMQKVSESLRKVLGL